MLAFTLLFAAQAIQSGFLKRGEKGTGCEGRPFDSVVDDCGTVHNTYQPPLKKAIDAGSVSGQAVQAVAYADDAADKARDAAAKADEQAALGKLVADDVANGEAEDAEKAADEARKAARKATSKSTAVNTAVQSLDTKLNAREPHKVTYDEINDSKDAIEEALKAGEEAHHAAGVATEQGDEAEVASSKFTAQLGAAVNNLAQQLLSMKTNALRASTEAETAASQCDDRGQQASDVADAIKVKYNLTEVDDPVHMAVVKGLKYDARTAYSYADKARWAAGNVTEDWQVCESAQTPINNAVSTMSTDSVTDAEMAAVKSCLKDIAASITEAERATDDADHYGDIAYKAAKTEEEEHVLKTSLA